MKGEYLREKLDHHTHSEATNMFAKLQQQHQQPPQFPHQQQPSPTFHHPFNLPDPTTTTNTTPSSTTIKKESNTNISSHDGTSIETLRNRRPRGRPPGSKNKPKPPIIITTQESEPPMSPYILELSPNIDIIKTIEHFCHKRSIGLCILSGSGVVANVTLRQPSTTTTPNTTVTFHGRFDILSISATIFPKNIKTNTNNKNGAGAIINDHCDFKISLGGPEGQVFGGVVVGPLASAGTIYLIAATCTHPCYQTLPLHEQESRNEVVSCGGGVDEARRRVGVSRGDGGHASAEGVGMYSCEVPSDAIWAPTVRPPPPSQPPPY